MNVLARLIPDPFDPVCDPFADTVEMPRIAFCRCGVPNTNADMVCDNCTRLDQDEFGRFPAVFEERLHRDHRSPTLCGSSHCLICTGRDWPQ
jgi:hypothetical protein